MSTDSADAVSVYSRGTLSRAESFSSAISHFDDPVSEGADASLPSRPNVLPATTATTAAAAAASPGALDAAPSAAPSSNPVPLLPTTASSLLHISFPDQQQQPWSANNQPLYSTSSRPPNPSTAALGGLDQLSFASNRSTAGKHPAPSIASGHFYNRAPPAAPNQAELENTLEDFKHIIAHARLKQTAFFSILMAGFGVTALVEIKFISSNGQVTLPATLLVPYAIIGSVQLLLCLTAFVAAAFIYPTVDPQLTEQRRSLLLAMDKYRHEALVSHRIPSLLSPTPALLLDHSALNSNRSTGRAPPTTATTPSSNTSPILLPSPAIAMSNSLDSLIRSNRSLRSGRSNRSNGSGDAVAAVRSMLLYNPSGIGYARFRKYIPVIWVTSSVFGIVFFFASCALIGVVRFYNYPIARTAVAAVLGPFCLLFLYFAQRMYRAIIAVEFAFHQESLARIVSEM